MTERTVESRIQSAAEEVMFGGRLTLARHGLEYRKGKSADDVNKALAKARKNGQQKTEFELSMLECYLGNVLKPVKQSHQ